MKKALFSIAICLLIMAQAAFAQPDTLQISKRKIFYHGERLSGQQLTDLLASIKDTEIDRLLSSYKTSSTVGYVVGTGGLVMMGVGEALDLADPLETNGLGLLVGGAGVMLGGGIVNMIGSTAIKKAILRYNDVVLGRTGSPVQSSTPPTTVSSPPAIEGNPSNATPASPELPAQSRTITLSLKMAGDEQNAACPLHRGGYLVHTSTALSVGSNKNTTVVNGVVNSMSKTGIFNLGVNGGKFLGRSFVLGGYFGIESTSYQVSEAHKIKSFLVKIGPYGRVYLPLEGKVQPFADIQAVLGLGARQDKYDNNDFNESKGLGYFGLGFGLGTSIFLSDRFALDLKFAYDIQSNAITDGDYSSGSAVRFAGIKTGFSFLLK